MTRPRYPSDDQRKKQRPHVKVHLSLRNHPRFAAICSDRELFGMLVRLWMVAGQAHASATGDEVTLTAGDVAWVTARQRAADSAPALRRLCAGMEYALRWHGACASISLRNFAKKQGFAPRLRTEPPRTPDPSEEPKNRRTDPPEARSARGAPEAGRVEEPSGGDPEVWAQMFARQEKQPPQGAVEWVRGVLPVIEGEADASFPAGTPTKKARNGKIKALLWRYWNHERDNGWRRPEQRRNGFPTPNERTKNALAERRAIRAQQAGGGVQTLELGVAADGSGHDRRLRRGDAR